VDVALWGVEGSKSTCTYGLMWCLGCDRRWCRISDGWVLMMNGEQYLFFVIRTVWCFFSFLFLDQTRSRVRVKHKHVDHLIVRTIKTLALIPNLMRNNEQKT
jgi:hypothetical protein